MEAARQLHSDTVATIQGKALYSNAEEKLLGTVASVSYIPLLNARFMVDWIHNANQPLNQDVVEKWSNSL